MTAGTPTGPPHLNPRPEARALPVLALHPPIRAGARRLAPDERLVLSAPGAKDLLPLVGHSPGRPLTRWMVGPLANAWAEGVTVAVENIPANPPEVFRIRRTSCHPPEHPKDVGEVTLDTSHVGASRVDLMAAHAALAGQLRHFYLSDSTRVAGKD